MELAATSSSLSLLERLPQISSEGTVHSVFRRAVNVTWEDEGWLGLIPRSQDLNPWAICLPELPALRPGDRVRISRSTIEFPRHPVRILLGDVHAVSLRLVSWDGRGSRSWADVGSRCAALARELGEHTAPCGFLDYATGRRCEAEDPFLAYGVEVLEGVRRERDTRDAAERLCSLVGLGRGLTPAGDDFLAGYLAASGYFSRATETRRHLAARLLNGMGRRTTEFGRRMLTAAAQGEYALSLGEFVKALGESEEATRRRAADLLVVGATSGADMIAGALWCLRHQDR